MRKKFLSFVIFQLWLKPDAQNVGIGTTTPLEKLRLYPGLVMVFHMKQVELNYQLI